MEHLQDYICCGSGADESRGVLEYLIMTKSDIPIKKRVKLAMRTSCSLISSCGGKLITKRVKKA